MVETLTRALHTPTPPESVSEFPELDSVKKFLEHFSKPLESAFESIYLKDKETHFQDILKKYLEDENHENLIARLKAEQPVLPLIAKSKNAEVEALQVLLESGHFGSTESCDSDGRTALSHAAQLQNRDFAKLLLQKGANTDTRDNDGRTPLSWAATPSQGIPKTIAFGIPSFETTSSMLMSHGAEINSEDNEKRTPLIWAIMQSSAMIIDELLDWEGIEARQRSRKDGEIKYELRPTLEGVEAHPFRGLRSSREVRSFLEMAFDDLNHPDKDDCTLLWWTVEFEDSHMVKVLLEEGANPNLNGGNPSDISLGFPFLRTLEMGNDDIISHFVDPGVFFRLGNQKDITSLHHLIQNEYIGETRALKMLRKALQMGYNPNQRDSQGNTLLFYAINFKKEMLALELIYKLGEEELNDPKRKTKGDTLLYYALENQMRKIVLNLMHCGAKVDLSHRDEWFKLGGEGTSYIRFSDSQRFEFIKSPNKDDWMSNDDKHVLCLHKETDEKWSRIEQLCEFREENKYFLHAYSRNATNSHISVSFPKEDQNEEDRFWGIEWSTDHQNGFHGFITTIPQGIIPNNEQELCENFLKYLHKKWGDICSCEDKRLEDIQKEQLKEKGKSRKIIKDLAQNSLRRAELRRCLQQHVEGLTDAIQNNDSLCQHIDLPKIIDNMDKSVNSRLFSLEQSSRELLQIEFAWVSISEATTMKRISLVTFIFLPLMFASSLFGMNVNLLADNPDWKWYLVIGASSLLLTLTMWMISTFNSTGFLMKAGEFLNGIWAKRPKTNVFQQKKPKREDSSDVDSKV